MSAKTNRLKARLKLERDRAVHAERVRDRYLRSARSLERALDAVVRQVAHLTIERAPDHAGEFVVSLRGSSRSGSVAACSKGGGET